ncbi:MAG TPA: hypothetical protein DDZ76_06815, partial [Xanthomonadales bacterium]|nr:hypothetical protein [Xanthomonadales bacterium]
MSDRPAGRRSGCGRRHAILATQPLSPAKRAWRGPPARDCRRTHRRTQADRPARPRHHHARPRPAQHWHARHRHGGPAVTALIDPSKHNQRARITATLHCLAPLHIGDGGVESFANRKQGQTLGKAARAATKDDSFYSTVCRDHAGRPILPGSSLRGLLRQATAQIDADRLEALFGPEAGEDKLSMGRVIVCDAPMSMGPVETQHLADFLPLEESCQRQKTGAGTCIAHNVSIDAITGAAAAVEHLLFAEEYVPAGSEFTLVLELGPCDDSDLGTILAVLNGFDGKAGHSLGAGASHGFGQFLVP